MVTDEFKALALAERDALGAPDHPLILLPHPIGSLKPEEARARADGGFSQLLDALVEKKN